jgi:hypothetical protein
MELGLLLLRLANLAHIVLEDREKGDMFDFTTFTGWIECVA